MTSSAFYYDYYLNEMASVPRPELLQGSKICVHLLDVTYLTFTLSLKNFNLQPFLSHPDWRTSEQQNVFFYVHQNVEPH